MKLFIVVVCLNNLFGIFKSNELKNNDRKLMQVQMVLRHTNRTPLLIYENSPCPLEVYQDGMGKITNEGIDFAYRFGQLIRLRYGKQSESELLAESHTHEIFTRSSTVDRCIQTAQAILFSLFPPNGTKYEWSKSINWFPLPIHTFPIHDDMVLRSESSYCPRLHRMIREKHNGKDVQNLFTENRQFLDLLSKKTGNVIDPSNIWDLYQTLQIEFLDSLSKNPICGKIPGWLSPKILLEFEAITSKFLDIIYYPSPKSGEEILPKLLGGPLLKAVLNNMDFNASDPNRVKLYLFSGHDSTIYHFLSALGIKREAYIQFLTSIIIELYQTASGEMELELHLYDSSGSRDKFIPLEFPKCPSPCRQNNFSENYKDSISTERHKECIDQVSHEL